MLRLTLLTLAVILESAACGGGTEPDGPGSTTPAEVASTPTTGGLARSVVQILALDSTGTPIWTGSGTVVSPDGLILTNAHVVDDRFDEYEDLAVAVIAEIDEPPDPSFLAEVVAVDYAIDLAVIRIVSDLNGNAVEPELPPIALGDSENVNLGDSLRILGFPGIGGETITLTEGSVSGFTSQRPIAGRAWIKTDATISGGNSGGLAANLAGEIIGIPTIVGSSEDLDTLVDCRYVVDTNRDGIIDTGDSCVPVGGFINGLRPIALAIPLVEAAQEERTYVSAFDIDPEPVAGFDTEDIFFNNLIFADGVTDDDLPESVFAALPTGSTEVCAFWDYEGMSDGLSWEALWFNNGELVESGSITEVTWFGGETGNWWVCYVEEFLLPEGLYELVLSVEDEVQSGDSVFVGGDHPLVEVEVANEGIVPVCFVYISPSQAENWGQDELGPAEIIDIGEVRTFFLPAAMYDLLIEDCDSEPLAEEYELDMSEGGTLTVS
ncbi:MAG: trypsin-like peptidase domain-containing protein [Chloroflexi bacterium]|nr:trypsin-like peptidase domain-containing protein [Chloroflexota bacterium]